MLDRALNDRTEIGAEAADRLAARPMLPLQTRALCLDIGGKTLIDGLDLRLEAADFTVVMGQNGAGKSLLLRLLHGLLVPSAGEILWGGQPMGDAVRARQAMVFQRPVLLRRSVAANIDFVLNLKAAGSPEQRDRLLHHVGLADKAAQPARLLSGGEQQRLALARVLALEPKVLFLDEPTASLDPASTIMIEDIVRKVHMDGTKVIFVTHDLGQARRLADEIVFLHEGRLEEQAPAVAFFDAPVSDVAKAFLEGRIVV